MTKQNIVRYAYYAALIVALWATFGSLYYSEIKHLVPCVLCWYQRIVLYPLPIILVTGLLLHDRQVGWYALPFSVIGLVISGYHSLLHLGVISEELAPCVNGISCAVKNNGPFGLTIPMMAFIAFAFIVAMLIVALKGKKND